MSERIRMITDWKVVDLVNELEKGNLRIPRFQRDYVWEPSKVVKLLNSILKEYPIGTFFLWETDKEMEGFCRRVPHLNFPDKPEAGRFSFILDGQQRITSLYVGLKGMSIGNKDYSKICFNLDKKEFRIPRPRPEQNDIPACRLFDHSSSMALVKQYTEQGNSDFVMAIMKCSELLRTYPLSIIKSLGMGLEEVVDIFERINQGGKRLSLFDLVHASVWSDEFDLRDKIKDFNDEPAIKLFGAVAPEVFTQSLALNTTNDCTKRHQLYLTKDACVAKWSRTVECLRLAIDFVRNFGVQQISIIPYQNMLAVIQHYFFHSKKSVVLPDDKLLISDWFWTVAFSQRYSSSTLTKMNEDAQWIREIGDGKKSPRIFAVKLGLADLRKARMNNRSVVKNGVLCVMAKNGPVDFDNGDEVTLAKTNASRVNSKENHHFFPFSLHAQFDLKKDDVNSVLNFAFITKRLNGEILNKRPSVYLSDYESANPNIGVHLEHHYIGHDAYTAARADDFERFVSCRGAAILDEINSLCRVESGVDFTPSESELSDDDDEDGNV